MSSSVPCLGKLLENVLQENTGINKYTEQGREVRGEQWAAGWEQSRFRVEQEGRAQEIQL